MANIDHTTAGRDARGRFQPGCSGNPAGKKPGTLNRATILKRVMAEGDDERIAKLIMERALKGEWSALRFVLERLEPKPRTRPIALDIPEDATIVERSEIVSRAMTEGEISPEEALQAMRVLDKVEDKRSTARLKAAMTGYLAAARAHAAGRPVDPPAKAAESAPDLHSASNARKPAARANAPRHAAPSTPATVSRRHRRAANAAAVAIDLLPRLAALAGDAAGWADDLHPACNLQP